MKLQFLLIPFTMSYGLVTGQNKLEVPNQYPTIQEALDSAKINDTIFIDSGIYYENLIWPISIANITLIGTPSTIIDGGYQGSVVSINNNTESQPLLASIEELTLRNGNSLEGGGLYSINCHLNLKGVTFKENIAQGDNSKGGGCFLDSYSGVIDQCIFSNNKCNSNTSSRGAGLYISSDSTILITNSEIKNNLIDGNFVSGSGLYMTTPRNDSIPLSGTHLIIDNCNIYQNTGVGINNAIGGAIALTPYLSSFFEERNGYIDLSLSNSKIFENELNSGNSVGAAIYTRASRNIMLHNLKVFRNISQQASGLYISLVQGEADIEIGHCVFDSNNSLSNWGNIIQSSVGLSNDLKATNINWFMYNTIISNNLGRGLWISHPENYDNRCEIINSTIFNNSEGVHEERTDIIIKNSYIQRKTHSGISQPYQDTFTYSIVGERVYSNQYIGVYGTHQPKLDFEFENPNILIPRLESILINGGDPNPILEYDLEFNPRGLPTINDVDIGAYEVENFYPSIQVYFYYDFDRDGEMNNEDRLMNIGEVVVNDTTRHRNFRHEGIFILTEEGDVSVSFDSNLLEHWIPTSQQLQYDFTIPNVDFKDTIYFGIFPKSEIDSFEFDIIPTGQFRCNDSIIYQVKLSNYGTTISSGELWSSIDSTLTDIFYLNQPNIQPSNNLVGWNYIDLFPGDELSRQFALRAPIPQNQDEIERFYELKAWLIPENIDSIFTETDLQLRCAYDPNSKEVNRKVNEGKIRVDDLLTYTIHFQNLGNDYAQDVVVVDTLDSNLDVESIQFVSSSHSEKLGIQVLDTEKKIVNFSFRNIYLPDSLFSPEGSKGYISFKVRPIKDLEPGSVIENRASIYFDFNNPIHTNMTTNVIEDVTVSNSKYQVKRDFFLYPNPVAEILSYTLNPKLISIFDTAGNLVYNLKDVQSIDVGTFASGVYLLKAEFKDKTVIYRRFIKL